MDPQEPTAEKAWPLWAKAFLKAFATTGNVTRAALAAKCDRSIVYDLRRTDESFATAFDSAKEEAADRLEQEAHRRAVEGVRRPILHQGKPVWVWLDKNGDVVAPNTKGAKRTVLTEHDYSDTLLIFLLNGARPEKYRKRLEHTGAEGAPLAPPVVLYLPDNGREGGPDAAPDSE